jgi:hypothetical protein
MRPRDRDRAGPKEGAGTVVQRIQDARGLDVGLVVRPVLGKMLRISTTGSAGRMLLATISVHQL